MNAFMNSLQNQEFSLARALKARTLEIDQLSPNETILLMMALPS
jgi:hypothetical protein